MAVVWAFERCLRVCDQFFYRRMLGEDLAELKVSDLLQLEQQLDLGASRVRARKASNCSMF